MKNYFLQVKDFIEGNYPSYNWYITGFNYPPSPLSILISQVATIIWIVGIILLLCGDLIFRTLNIPMPKIIQDINNNKVFCFGVLFIINSLGNSQLATGAFEMYLNDELIYSKLATGRLPSGEEVLNLLVKYGYPKVK
mmetsp:Transcript_10169/g.9109  ORF Transcript_10169/g.9109 Transcript_10169/m.9109 type:complete len:138 (-) Transcript_10169:71-484(-)